MKKAQKGFANVILIALVVVLVWALGYFTLVKKSELVEKQTEQNHVVETVPVDSPTQVDKTLGWKIYANSTYGFEVRYPGSYSEFHKTGDSSVSFRSTEGCRSLVMGGGEWPADCQDYSISIQKNNISVAGITRTFIDVAGMKAESTRESSGGMWDNMAQIVVQFQKGQNWYVQTFTYNKGKAQVAESVMNQILATFKFTTAAVQASVEYSLFKDVDNWVLDYQDKSHQVSSGQYSMVCSDGKKGNTTSSYVFSMNSSGYGERPGDIDTPYKKVLGILQNNGWQQCRNLDQTDMQSPSEIFIKNNKLIGIFRHSSMGTGNSLQVSIQY